MSVRVDHRAISVAAAYAALGDPLSGGVALFVGRVRPDRSTRGRVHALFYEAHRPVALAQLKKLEAAAKRRFGARRVVLWHRLGSLPVGSPSVLIGVAAPHRAAALSACRHLIDRLKSEVPIWKTDLTRPGRPPPRRRARRPGQSAG